MAATLFEDILERGRAERERQAMSRDRVSRDDCAPELSPIGLIRWYLHPALELPSTRALYFYELEIPVGSRSGRLHCQGGIVHFVLEGSGYTELDGERHQWEAEDCIALPTREYGITYQHVNTGNVRVRMVATWPNFDSALGPEVGVAMTVLENAPEYDARRVPA